MLYGVLSAFITDSLKTQIMSIPKNTDISNKKSSGRITKEARHLASPSV
jgi:hypothetical protein